MIVPVERFHEPSIGSEAMAGAANANVNAAAVISLRIIDVLPSAVALRRGAFVKRLKVSRLCLEEKMRRPTLSREEVFHDRETSV